MLEHQRATIWNQSNCFSAKLSSSVCLKLEHRRASISVSRRSFRLQFDAPPRRFLGRTELPAAAQDRRHEALARAYEARAMLVIVSIILLALIVAAVGRGGLILAWRLRSLLDIAAVSP